MGIWTSTQESFLLKPYLHVTYSGLSNEPILKLYVTNKGHKTDKILRVEIRTSGGTYYNDDEIEIEAGFSGLITISDWNTSGSPDPISPGNKYRIYIFTSEHGMLFYDIYATSS